MLPWRNRTAKGAGLRVAQAEVEDKRRKRMYFVRFPKPPEAMPAEVRAMETEVDLYRQTVRHMTATLESLRVSPGRHGQYIALQTSILLHCFNFMLDLLHVGHFQLGCLAPWWAGLCTILKAGGYLRADRAGQHSQSARRRQAGAPDLQGRGDCQGARSALS